MSARYTSRNRRRISSRPFVGFLLVASFGILFAGCRGPEDIEDDFVFTQDDVTRYRELANDAMNGLGTGSTTEDPFVEPLESGSGASEADSVVLDLSQVDDFSAMRSGNQDADTYQVTNEFLNIRANPSTTAALLVRLDRGANVEVLEFVDSQWAKVKTGTTEGFASHQYLSKMTSDEQLAAEQKAFENMYYVSFGFVNMRKEARQDSEKIVEIPGRTLLKASSVADGWAKVNYNNQEGYVSLDFVSPFMPNFIVRQNMYDLPVLHYRVNKDQQTQILETMKRDIAAIKAEGYTFITLRDLQALLTEQLTRDVRLEPNRAVIAVSGMNSENLKAISDALVAENVNATIFIETKNIGIAGITEKRLLTLMANGYDIQSATHTGDDLRALTNAQVELELKQSRKLLEDYTRKPVFAIGFPQGGVNDRVAQIAAEAGYLFGLGDGAKRSFSRNEFLKIPAMQMSASTSIESVKKFVTGQ